jgi:anti-sigma regulatory factor (Ser/Thr protein kinase)
MQPEISFAFDSSQENKILHRWTKWPFMSQKEYSFELRNSLSELDKLRKHIETVGRQFGLPRKFVFEMNLSLDELLTNIICHGFADDGEHIIRMTIAPKKDGFCIFIEDDGIPFNPTEFDIPEIPGSIEECKIGGLGIHIVRKLVDDICYQRCDDKNVLKLKKRK